MQSSENRRQVVFENKGPSGYVVYHNGTESTKFYMEFIGGNCIFFIWVPSEKNWEKETGFSLEARDEILAFIANESLKKQCRVSGAYFKVNDSGIAFYTP